MTDTIIVAIVGAIPAILSFVTACIARKDLDKTNANAQEQLNDLKGALKGSVSNLSKEVEFVKQDVSDIKRDNSDIKAELREHRKSIIRMSDNLDEFIELSSDTDRVIIKSVQGEKHNGDLRQAEQSLDAFDKLHKRRLSPAKA